MLKKKPERTPVTARTLWLAIAVACAGMLGFALYSQYVWYMYPCPLCMFQRVAVIALGVIALLAALHNPRRRGMQVYGVLAAVVGAIGVAIAGRHVYIQNLPADQVPTCGAGLDFMLETLPIFTVIRDVLTASGECATVSWRFLGLTMPAWVAVCLVVLTLAALLAGFVLGRRRA